MNVTVKSIQTATKPHHLAEAAIELSDAEGNSVVISDVCVLKDKYDHSFVVMPDKYVGREGRSYKYRPQVLPNHWLKQKIDHTVLSAYEKWTRRTIPFRSQSQKDCRSTRSICPPFYFRKKSQNRGSSNEASY